MDNANEFWDWVMDGDFLMYEWAIGNAITLEVKGRVV